MQLETHGTSGNLLLKRLRQAGIAFAQETEVHREGIRRLQHAGDVPRSRRAGGGVGAGRRAGAAAEHGGDARHQRLFHLLRADEVDVGIDAASGEDLALAGDGFGARADGDGDARLGVRVAGLADGVDATVANAHIGLDDAPMVDDEGVGDDGVDGPCARKLALPHAVPDHLAATELDLFAVDGVILLDLDDEFGVAEAHAVADGGAKHLGIGGAGDGAHAPCSNAPMTLAWKP